MSWLLTINYTSSRVFLVSLYSFSNSRLLLRSRSRSASVSRSVLDFLRSCSFKSLIFDLRSSISVFSRAIAASLSETTKSAFLVSILDSSSYFSRSFMVFRRSSLILSYSLRRASKELTLEVRSEIFFY